MWSVKTKVITVIILGDWDYFKVIRKIHEKHKESRNYRKQPYWALHTFFGKC